MKPFHSFSLVPFVFAGALLLGSLPARAAKEEGKFHLIYRVIVPSVETGAEARIEPALLTNGDRIVFAWDYCRWEYPKKNYNYKAAFNENEDRLDRNYITVADQADLEHYCQGETYNLRGAEFSVLDNAGVRLTIGDATFVAAHVKGEGVQRRGIPERFHAPIQRIDGTVAAKLPAALEDKQPYVFVMSRNRTLLEQIVVQTATPKPPEAAVLLARLEQYKARRQASDPKAANEQCETYVPHRTQRASWQAISGTPLAMGEILYTDLDGDGRTELIVRLVEDPKRLAMTRVYDSKGTEHCVLRNEDGNMNSPIYRPLTLFKTNSCVYAFTQTSTYQNPNMNLIPLTGSPKTCLTAESYRFHERH